MQFVEYKAFGSIHIKLIPDSNSHAAHPSISHTLGCSPNLWQQIWMDEVYCRVCD